MLTEPAVWLVRAPDYEHPERHKAERDIARVANCLRRDDRFWEVPPGRCFVMIGPLAYWAGQLLAARLDASIISCPWLEEDPVAIDRVRDHLETFESPVFAVIVIDGPSLSGSRLWLSPGTAATVAV